MNKVQEALNNLFDSASTEYDVDEDTGELFVLDCTNSDKHIDMREPIQQLIDCQLTKEEFDYAINYTEYLLKQEKAYEGNSAINYFYGKILSKLQKQKKIMEEE